MKQQLPVCKHETREVQQDGEKESIPPLEFGLAVTAGMLLLLYIAYSLFQYLSA